jgi:hypothetical protein
MIYSVSEISLFIFKKNVKDVISKGIEYLKEIITKYTPCLYKLKNGMLCGIAAAWHNTGHFKEKEVGPHFFPTQYNHKILEQSLKQHINRFLKMVLTLSNNKIQTLIHLPI